MLFPADGITKADLAEHYERVAARMLPHVRDRPLSLQVFPGGIEKRGHFLKQIPDYFPDWIDRVELPKHGGTVTHIVARDADTLRMLAQHNAITPHIPTARNDRLQRPDRLIIDFDPESPGQWDTVVAGARAAGDIVREEGGLEPFFMTTGSRGLHVVVPIRRELDYPDVLALAKAIGRLTLAECDGLTMEFNKDKREGRVFVDCLRNRRAHTAVVPWAVRAKPGAPVATPVAYGELTPELSPRAWSLRDLRAGDPWEGFSSAGASPRPAARKLAGAAE